MANIINTNDHPIYHFHHKREPAHRIFVNRSLNMSTIKFIGFDMDYTLAVYKSPELEVLTFTMSIERLISIGYPEDFKSFKYDPTFAVRGIWFDKTYGNLVKTDIHGNILKCFHGLKELNGEQTRKYYPNKYLTFDESRICVLDTLYELPVCYLFSSIIEYFSSNENYKEDETGVSFGDLFLSYKAIYQDIIEAVDHLYISNKLQTEVTQNLSKYIHPDDQLHLLLQRLRENNVKTFLLTNSGFSYANSIMGYLLNAYDKTNNWRNFFDYIIVDAGKPLYFAEGKTLKEVDLNTGKKHFCGHSGPLLPNHVYSGGSCDVFSKMIGANDKDVLYVGDHIFSDIIKSKKVKAWRTFLIVPELAKELSIWHDKRELFNKIQDLEDKRAVMLLNMDSSCKDCPDFSTIEDDYKRLTHELEIQFSQMGSCFRNGSTQSYFAAQIARYADIYAATHLNLLHYPFFYFFQAPPMLMPHEFTVDPNKPFHEENPNDSEQILKKIKKDS